MSKATPQSHTTQSAPQTTRTAGAFGTLSTDLAARYWESQQDARARFWATLGKQVRHGAAVKVNVKA